MDNFDTLLDCEVTEELEKLTEAEKEHMLLQCSDAKSEEEVHAAAEELKLHSMSDMIAAMANTDIGNTTENSGVR